MKLQIVLLGLVVILAACSASPGPSSSILKTTTTALRTTTISDLPTTTAELSTASSIATTSKDTTTTISGVKEFSITAKNWEFIPETIEAKEGDTVIIHIKSIDVDHGFALPEFNVNKRLSPGATVDIEFVADKKGTYSFFCNVWCGEGHSHMSGSLTVT